MTYQSDDLFDYEIEDARHAMRLSVVQGLFAHSFEVPKNKPVKSSNDAEKVLAKIIANLTQIDKIIQENAPKFPLSNIAKTDLAILRLAVYELVITPEMPHKVIVNEAVELAKELGSDKSYSFVNGVLGSVIKEQKSV
jgi:transcription antitermination protein NusB